jgi:hypothetical protein
MASSEDPASRATELLHALKRALPDMKSALFEALRARSYRLSFPSAPTTASPSPFAFPVAGRNPLELLGEKYKPTKVKHNYLPYYWMHLRDIHRDAKHVLEVGVQTDHSIRMWEEFFPNATIYGLDIDPACKQFEGGRRKIYIGDQGDPAFLRDVIAKIGAPLDVVIDDGSHRPEHQLVTFDHLFPAMSSHGVYAVEDTGAVVGDAELRTVNELKRMVDHVLHWPKGVEPADWPFLTTFGSEASWADRNIIGVAFYRWIVFVLRGRNPEDNPHLKPKP